MALFGRYVRRVASSMMIGGRVFSAVSAGAKQRTEPFKESSIAANPRNVLEPDQTRRMRPAMSK
jgi:hypothetical protein